MSLDLIVLDALLLQLLRLFLITFNRHLNRITTRLAIGNAGFVNCRYNNDDE